MSPRTMSLAELLWNEEVSRRGEFPTLEPVSEEEVKRLMQVKRATPDSVGRRDVGTWDGQPIWFRQTNGGVRWMVLTWHQDQRLLRGV